ncbi:hypothetical protein O59_001375 [Cellvibrio sp. BR]|uniref:hypothetical protein n=1 Tax=Cellvibrio sp. BR TaxID=1134474 RepID=UPI000260129A|nr:hypothetical protein [Cellvibrio sp. BR]EIK45736.1 hypothetical protein O59_001375 [Cellvibrio sp. BR]
MTNQSGATTLGEGQYEFKTDVNLIFGNQRVERSHVLRTSAYSISIWKTRNPGIGLSPFKDRTSSVTKEASIIDKEIWVFGINATSSQDIVNAVKLASRYYNTKPSDILSDIYAKNLNDDREADMANEVLIRANKALYSDVCKALVDAAKLLGISNQLNFYVFSKSNNPKIPQPDLIEALKTGGASSAATDDHKPRVSVGNNLGTRSVQQLTNFHLAKLKCYA